MGTQGWQRWKGQRERKIFKKRFGESGLDRLTDHPLPSLKTVDVSDKTSNQVDIILSRVTLYNKNSSIKNVDCTDNHNVSKESKNSSICSISKEKTCKQTIIGKDYNVLPTKSSKHTNIVKEISKTFKPSAVYQYEWDSCASITSRLVEPNEDVSQCPEVNVTLADGVSRPVGRTTKFNELVWTKGDPTMSHLLAGTLGTTSTNLGGGGLSYIDTPGSTKVVLLSKDDAAFISKKACECSSIPPINVDKSSGRPVISSDDAKIIRIRNATCLDSFQKGIPLIDTQHQICRARVKSSHLFHFPIADLDVLFIQYPDYFKLVDRFKNLFRVTAKGLYRMYATSKNALSFVERIQSIVKCRDNEREIKSSYDKDKRPDDGSINPKTSIPSDSNYRDLELNRTVDKTPKDEFPSFVTNCILDKEGISQIASKCSRCDSHNSFRIGNQRYCPFCDHALFKRFSKRFVDEGIVCPSCQSDVHIVPDGVNGLFCAICSEHIKDDLIDSDCESDQGDVEPSNSISSDQELSTVIDENSFVSPPSPHVTWGYVEIFETIPVRDDSSSTGVLSDDEDGIDSADQSSNDSLSSTDTMWDTDLPNVDGEEVIKRMSVLNGGQLVRAWETCHFVRAILTRSRSPMQFDPAANYLSDVDAHDLCHLKHGSDCADCSAGREQHAPQVRGGSSRPTEGCEYLTYDYIGPLKTATNGHRYIAAIARYRVGISTPEIFCQSVGSRVRGVSAVILHQARAFFGILASPFEVHTDCDRVLNDKYVQNYVNLCVLPKSQMNFHARSYSSVPSVSYNDSNIPGEVSSDSTKPGEVSISDPYCKLLRVASGRLVEDNRPAGRTPEGAQWSDTHNMWIYRPLDDSVVRRSRGRPLKEPYQWIDSVGYVQPCDPDDILLDKVSPGEIRNGLPYRSNSNSRAERACRFVIEYVRAILHRASFPPEWWHLAVQALPTLLRTAKNREEIQAGDTSTKRAPGYFVGKVVPLGTIGKAKLPRALKKKSNASQPVLQTVVCAGFNTKSSLGVKVLYHNVDNGIKTLRSTYISCKDVAWDIGKYAFSKSVENLKQISVLHRSMLSSMLFDTSLKKPKSLTIVQCSKSDCLKWRYISRDKLVASEQKEKWVCHNCDVPQDKSIYANLEIDPDGKKGTINDVCQEFVQLPPLVDRNEDEPIAVEDDEVVRISRLFVKAAASHDSCTDNSLNDIGQKQYVRAVRLPDSDIVKSLIDSNDHRDDVKNDITVSSCKPDFDKFNVEDLPQCAFQPISSTCAKACEAEIVDEYVKSGGTGDIKVFALVIRNKEVFDKKHPEYGQWCEALDEELNNLLSEGVVEAVKTTDLPANSDHSVIPSMLVSVQKTGGRRKCRLVACGNWLEADTSLYASTVGRQDIFPLIYWSLSSSDFDWASVDIKTAFLQSDRSSSKEDVYLKPPAVAQHATSNCKLSRDIDVLWHICASIYGLRSAPKDWAMTFRQELNKHGFKSCIVEDSILVSTPDSNGVKTVVTVFVDDLNVFGPIGSVNEVMKKVMLRFKVSAPPQSIRDTDALSPIRFLAQDYYLADFDGKNHLVCSMSRYIVEMLERHDLNDVKITKSLNQSDFEDEVLQEGTRLCSVRHKRFRGIVAALGYLAGQQRLDILTPVSILQSHQHEPREGTWKALYKLVGYVKRTVNRVLCVPIGDPWVNINVESLSDASLAQAGVSRGGHILGITPQTESGESIFLPVSWRSQKQRTLCLSTTESEITQLSACFRESLGLIRVMTEWLPTYVKINELTVHGDCHAANLISNGECNTRKVRHLLLNQLFSRELCREPERYGAPLKTKVKKIDTDKNSADLLTKILPENKILPLLKFLGFRDLESLQN